MNTQQFKNNKCIAISNYNRRQKSSRLKGELIAFFSALSIICTCLYIIISSLPY